MNMHYHIDLNEFKPKYEVICKPVDGDYKNTDFIGRFDTKEEALKAINDIEFVEGKQYIVNYKYPDMYASVLDY